jgi:hypothetical protein
MSPPGWVGLLAECCLNRGTVVLLSRGQLHRSKEKKMNPAKLCTMALAVLCLTGAALASQPDLKAEILAMDKKLFDAFNARDLETTKAIFDPTLEFFHDTGGVSNYDKAIANSQHTFCHTENQKLDCGTFKFLNIWKNTKGTWTLVRVVSYAH